MAKQRAGRTLLLAAALCLSTYFSCQLFVSKPKPPTQDIEKMALVAAATLGAAMPAYANTPAADLFQKGYYGTQNQAPSWDHCYVWSNILVPLTGLVFPFVTMGVFTLASYSDEFFYTRLANNHPKFIEKNKAWKRLPMFANYDDPMKGFVDMEDWEAGLVQAWDKVKPKGTLLDAKKKLAEMKVQNAPHAAFNKVWNNGPGNGSFTSRKDYDKGIYPKDAAHSQGLARSA